jgi:hypothetical protein
MGKARHNLNSAANRRKELLTPEQAQDVARWVVAETRAVLLLALEIQYARTGNPEFKPDLATATLSGYCGLAQCFIDVTLQDYGFVSKPVAMQTLPYGGFPHVALAAEFETTQGKKIFLFDPSFRQFCTGKSDEPGAILAGLPGGKELRTRLLGDGFFELDPEKAFTYLSSFYKGRPPAASRPSALKFFTRPRESEMNYWYPREKLAAWGFLKRGTRPGPPLP